MSREVLTAEQFARTLAEQVSIALVPGMESGRIVRESTSEGEFGPSCRRLTIYAMSPETWHRAHEMAYMWFGKIAERRDWDMDLHALVDDRALHVPVLTNGYQARDDEGGYDRPAGITDWKVNL